MIASRRRFLFGAGATLLAAPAIVRVASLMVVKPLPSVEFTGTELRCVQVRFAQKLSVDMVLMFNDPALTVGTQQFYDMLMEEGPQPSAPLLIKSAPLPRSLS